MARTKLSKKRRKIIFEKFNYTCQLCGLHIYPKCIGFVSRRWLEIDHIKAYVLGGTNDIDNLQVLCNVCNCKKGIK